MTLINPQSDARRIYQIPQDLGDSLSVSVESVSTTVPRPLEAREIAEGHRERERELVEAASRLAIGSTPLYEQTIQEFAAHPGPENSELWQLTQVGRTINQLRQEKANQIINGLSWPMRTAKYPGLGPREIMSKITADLIDQESYIGGSVFGKAASGEVQQLHYENSRGQDEWYFTRRSQAHSNPFFVLHYILQPDHILKMDARAAQSEIVEPDEAATLLIATMTTLDRLKRKLYTPPSIGR